MPDELKSAWELALEKLDADEDMAVAKLTDQQKETIAEIRRKYQAKMAEAEIGSQSDLRKAAQDGDHEALVKVQARLQDEKRRLDERMEAEIQQARAGDSASSQP